MNWPVVEVVIGMAFFFLLMSTLASAINEGIANLFSLRARGLEQGIASMLGDGHAQAFFETAIVLSQRKPDNADTKNVGNTNGQEGKQKTNSKKPSYLGAPIFTDALQALFGVEGTAFQLDLEKVKDPGLRTNLEEFAAKVGNDATQFRKELETWFDATMNRASGWYKRRSHLILFFIGIVLAGAANLSAVTVGQRLWSDSTLRSIVTANWRTQ